MGPVGYQLHSLTPYHPAREEDERSLDESLGKLHLRIHFALNKWRRPGDCSSIDSMQKVVGAGLKQSNSIQERAAEKMRRLPVQIR